MKKTYSTTYLFGVNGFFAGMACALNLGGNFFDYKGIENPFLVDAQAIENDWGVIGQDIQEAMNIYE